MSISRLLNKWLNRLYKIAAILLVFVAVLISAMRLFLPYAHNYRDNFENYINTTFNSNISIGVLSMGWQKSGPTLLSTQVELLDTEQVNIYVESLALEVDFWRSIQTGKLVTKDFLIAGAQISFDDTAITTEQGGNDEHEQQQQELSLQASIESLFLEQISRFSITDSHVTYKNNIGERAFKINQLTWFNDGEHHSAKGDITVDGVISNNINILMDITGSELEQLSGQVYFSAKQLNITPWLGTVFALDNEQTNSAINFDAWMNIDHGRASTLQVALGDNEITWQHQDKAESFQIESGDILIRNLAGLGNYTVTTSPLIIKRNHQETNRLTIQSQFNGEAVNGYISSIELSSFNGVFPLLFDDIAVEKMLLELAPQGQISDIYFQQSGEDLSIAAQLNQATSQFSQGIPGINNVSGELLYHNGQLLADLSAVDGALNFDKHFILPIPYTELALQLHGEFSTQGWRLNANNVNFNSSEISLQADVNVSAVNGQPIEMALLANVSHADAINAGHYYPQLLMGENLVGYLNSAIISGRIEQAQVLFNGPLSGFPFNDNSGIFVVDAELSDSQFAFDSQWPAIENFNANLNFTNNSMLITGRSGELSGIDVTGVVAAIDELAGQQILTVDAQFKQTKPRLVQQLMHASPMRDSVGATLERVVIGKPIDGNFSLILPLKDTKSVIAQGAVNFIDNNIALQTPAMDFHQVNGRLRYHNDKITVDDLTLTWRDMPMQLSVLAQNQEDKYQVSINTLGNWQTAQWQAQLPESIHKYGQGTLLWQGALSLDIAHDGEFSYDYKIQSALADIQFDLPAPFDKTTGSQAKFFAHVSGSDSQSVIEANLDNQVDFYGILDHQKNQFSLAHLVLGKEQLWLPTDGFHITAELENADYEKWQPLVLDIIAATSASTKTEDSNMQTAAMSSDVAILSAPRRISGEIKHLAAYGQTFNEVSFELTPQAHWWALETHAKEVRAKAKFYPDWLEQGIDIDADFVYLTNQSSSDGQVLVNENQKVVNSDQVISNAENETIIITNKTSATSKVEPRDVNEQAVIDVGFNDELFAQIPPLKVRCASCKYGLYDFGELSFTIERESPELLVLKNFNGKRGKTELAFDVRWHKTPQGTMTNLIGRLESNNVAREMENLGYASIIKDSGVKITYDVSWQGGPHDFSLTTFDGDISAKFDAGYLDEVDDKGARMLSVLSLQSLVKILSFDFRDIFGDGMFYSKMGGSFTLKDGVAYTDNIKMKGTAGDLTIVGNTNLNTGDLDYRLSYKPNLTSSLPVLAWIATLNPVTFLAGVALDEVITSKVISEIKFEVTGNLDDPQIKQVSRKSQNISVGRSTPPQIVENTPEEQNASDKPTQEPLIEAMDKIDG